MENKTKRTRLFLYVFSWLVIIVSVSYCFYSFSAETKERIVKQNAGYNSSLCLPSAGTNTKKSGAS